ncbi:MAG: anti-sigma factor, partial [Ilumatobacteraceae bacterium]|nr:anti-sigma factor [Ilumatobacteraceae bacterium]
APDGFYYEAWLRKSPEVGVSAGTFHLRGGDGSIQLWAGVALDEYPILTVTLQTEGGGAASSGIVVLAGKID